MIKEKVAVLIVAHNEARVIGDLIRNISKDYKVYVASDGSTDETDEISKKQGANVISIPINVGQGAAVIIGYKVITMENYEYIIKMDGDGQHNPDEINKLIGKLKESNVDTVIGSRILGSNYKEAPLARKFFLRPLTWVLNRLTGYHLTDSMSGYRAFRGESLKKMLSVFNQIQEPEYMASEMWIRFAHAGFTVDEAPISMSKRKAGFSYKGLFRYGWGVISTIIRTKFDIYSK